MSNMEVKKVQVRIIDLPEDNKEKEEEKEETKEVEAEKKVAEELKEESVKSLKMRIKEHWQLMLKIVELLLCALCLGMFIEPTKQSANMSRIYVEQVAVILLAFAGYLLINAIFIVSHFIKDKIPFRISTLFSLVAAILFFVSGILLTADRKKKFQGYWEVQMSSVSMLSAATVFAFVNAVLFAVDGVYTFILKEDF
ncbi:uncharacterized protein [Euwallacea fornicatus]|uniref:uncharacterized protein n=1 Tax=Euwallacea fornicatus TaxID=995702 RepID=UPI00338F1963